jgi:hypothetical protein
VQRGRFGGYDATLHQGYDEICFANYDVISWQKMGKTDAKS